MDLQKIENDGESLVSTLNADGIPIPLIRDPVSKVGSVPLSLVVLSTLLVVVGIISKWAGKLGGIDMNMAMQFFYASCSLYVGHTLVAKPVTPTVHPNAPVDNPDNN
jgi:hypothetical protein